VGRRLSGKVALITGAARGQGRAHALRMAEEGADIIAIDIADDVAPWLPYHLSTPEDFAETVRLVEDQDRRIIARRADVRDRTAMQAIVDEAMEELGHIDIACANAGIAPMGPKSWEITQQQWDDVIGVNLTGVWNTAAVVIPQMIERGEGGSLIFTSSGAALRAVPNLSDYCAAKAGVIGYMKSLALEVGRYSIRVNAIAPCAVDTPMINHEAARQLFRPDRALPTRDDMAERMQQMSVLPEPWVEARDVANAAVWLASDEARFVTGIVLPVDLGVSSK
jgi:(+)-trans-carveol dehydrogenase